MPSLNVTLQNRRFDDHVPNVLPSMVVDGFLNPVREGCLNLAKSLQGSVSSFDFLGVFVKRKFNGLCPPSVISLEETVNELMLLLTSAAFTD